MNREKWDKREGRLADNRGIQRTGRGGAKGKGDWQRIGGYREQGEVGQKGREIGR